MIRRLLSIGALGVVLSSAASFGNGTTYVRPYVRHDGTTVQGHYRTTPDQTPNNNWSTRGNVNPYTGQEGTKRYPNSNPSYPTQGYGNNNSNER